MSAAERVPLEHARAALIVSAAFLALYACTAAPGLLFGDAGEFQTVAMLGGIPHSSGYPGWWLLARLFAHLPFGAPEFRVTLLSVVCGAAAMGMLVRVLGRMGVGLAASVTAAACFGVTFSMWRVSLRAEVYTLSILLALVALDALLRARRSGAFRDSLAAGFLLGLILTAHLDFAPPVGIAGLALAARELRRDSPSGATAGRLVLLLASFLAGLSPYLLLVALDARHVPANFLDLVRHAQGLLGVDRPPLDTPWQRVWWLMTGRNVYPPIPFSFHPRSLLPVIADCGALVVLFELGPLAVVLALAGFARRRRRDATLAWAMAIAIAGTVLLASLLQTGAMLQLFQLPAMLIGAIFLADGLDALFERLSAGGVRSRLALPALALGLWAMLAVPPHFIRAWASTHPIGPRGWHSEEEDRSLEAGLFPTMRDTRPAEPWARAVLAAIPRDALVMAAWSEFTPLRHLRLVEGLRPDLTLDQIAGETLAKRVRQWQAAHDPMIAPVVFAERGNREAPWIAAADSIGVGDGRYVYVLRREVP